MNLTDFKLASATPVIQAYIDRINARPAFVRIKVRDAELAAAQAR